MIAELGPRDGHPDPGPARLPHAPMLRPRVGPGRRPGTDQSDAGNPPTPHELDAGDLPTPSDLAPRADAAAAAAEDTFDMPSVDHLEPEDQPTPIGLRPDEALAALAQPPMTGPTRPMQVIDVRAALLQADFDSLPTARMESNPSLLIAENDLRTRPMAVQENLAGKIASLTARPKPAPAPPPEDADTAADVPAPDVSQGDDWASGDLDPFFFED